MAHALPSQPVEETIAWEKYPKKAGYSEILRTCADIADERHTSYGDVEPQFQDTCDIAKAAFGRVYTVEDVAIIMISTKLSRQKNSHKEDNFFDVINYIAILLTLIRSLAKRKLASVYDKKK